MPPTPKGGGIKNQTESNRTIILNSYNPLHTVVWIKVWWTDVIHNWGWIVDSITFVGKYITFLFKKVIYATFLLLKYNFTEINIISVNFGISKTKYQ